MEKDYSQLPKYHYLWTQYFVTPTAEDAYTIKLIEDTFNVDIEVPNIEDVAIRLLIVSTVVSGEHSTMHSSWTWATIL